MTKVKLNLHTILIFFIFIVSPLQSSAIDPASTISTAATLESLKGMVNDVIDTATNRADYILFRAGTELLISIQSWEKANTNLLDTAFTGLTEQQQIFFTKSERLAKLMTKEVSTTFEKAEILKNEVHNLVATLPTVDNHPTVSSYSPAIIPPLNIENSMTFKVNGAVFKYGKPFIKLGDNTFFPDGNTSNQLIFKLSELESLLTVSDKNIMLTLTLFRPADGVWAWITNAIEPVDFKLPMIIAPNKYGKYTLQYEYTEQVTKRERKERLFHHSGTSGSALFNQGVSSSERNMDNIRSIKEWGASSSHKIESQNSKSFSVRINVNRQNKPFGGYPPGYRHAIYEWFEIWKETQTKEKSASETIEWGQDIAMSLPRTLTKFTLIIDGIDGRKHAFNSSGIKGFYDVNFNEANKQLILSVNQ